MPKVTLFELNNFCRETDCEAIISGDDMLAFIYDIATGLWIGVLSLC